MTKKNALGVGLGQLIRNAETPVHAGTHSLGSEIPVALIEANPFQPRTNFDEEALQELAASIKQLGIVQPITVRKLGEHKYQLIAGERRLRASQLAGLKTVPAFVRDVSDDQHMLEMALIENIQREDLNAMDVALSYQRLIEECSLTQEILSDRVGKKRPTITNYLRLLRLPPQIQIAVRNQEITMGHAKALINMEHPEQQMDLFARVVREGLSVRQTEELARTTAITGKSPEKSVSHVAVSPAGKACSESFSNWLQRPVELKPASKGKGRIVIPYFSDQDLRQLSQTIESLLRNS
jgi:ParB family chromosome partitioning protein